MLVYTGQRVSEIAALVWGDIHLGKAPYVLVRESTTKDKAQRAIPLHPGLADALLKARPVNAAQDAKVFDYFPTWDMFIYDLKRAGIDRKDALGRVVHMHALRKTFQTMGVQAGINQRAAQEFLGHSDANLTAKIYTDMPAVGLHGEIAKLEWVGEKKGLPSEAVTNAPKNKDLIHQLKDLVSMLETLGNKGENKGLGNNNSTAEMAARAGIETLIMQSLYDAGQIIAKTIESIAKCSGHIKLPPQNAS